MGLLQRLDSLLTGSEELLRDLRHEARRLSDQLSGFIGRAELVRLRSAQVQDFLMGIYQSGPHPTPSLSKLPDAHTARMPIGFEPLRWPIPVGTYDAFGHPEKIGMLGRLGLILTYAEVVMALSGLVQERRPSEEEQRQLFLAFRALSRVAQENNLDEEGYVKLWRSVLSKSKADE